MSAFQVAFHFTLLYLQNQKHDRTNVSKHKPTFVQCFFGFNKCYVEGRVKAARLPKLPGVNVLERVCV